MFFAEYSSPTHWQLLRILIQQASALTQNMYTRICAGLVATASFTQDSARLPERLERKKERKKDEDEQFAWATISVYHFRNVCQPR